MEEISVKKKVIMGTALAILILIGLLVKMGGATAARMVEQVLAKQNVVTGTLTYDRIGAGLAGDVEIRELVWKTPNGRVKAEIPRVTLSVNFLEALKKGPDIGSITNIVMEHPVFYGTYEEGQGLDILKAVKFAGEPALPDMSNKTGKVIEPTRFRGLVEIKDGTFNLMSNGKEVSLGKLNVQGAFRKYPVLKFSATARKDDADLVIHLDKNDKEAKITGEAKNVAVADLMALYPELGCIEVKEGVVPTLTISGSRDSQGWHFNLSGKAGNLAGNVYGCGFTEGEANFFATRDEADINRLAIRINGMPLEVKGKILSGRGTKNPPSFDLEFKAVNFATKAVSGGMVLDDASLNIRGALTGNALEPDLRGEFTSQFIPLPGLPLTDVTGKFREHQGKLVLEDTWGKCGGKVAVNGAVDLASRDYTFTVAGRRIDAAALTDNRITGLLYVNLAVKGTNEANSATGDGVFQLEDGRFYYEKDGKDVSDELRYMEGMLTVRNGELSVERGVVKLGRSKYEADVRLDEKGHAVVTPGKRISWSLF